MDTTDMELRLFHFQDSDLLDPDIEGDTSAYLNKLSDFSREILFCVRSNETVEKAYVSEIRLEGIASWYCDKWILNTEQHMTSYMNANQMPRLKESGIPNPILGETNIIKSKSFSGDASGVIGEALFAYLLIDYYGVHDDHFAHFQASGTTGLYPDFGIHEPTERLQDEFQKHCELGSEYFSLHSLIPVEVKSMTGPTYSIVKKRLGKATQQIRNFWKRRYQDKEVHRGPSIIFLALRNERRHAYDGVLLWMK